MIFTAIVRIAIGDEVHGRIVKITATNSDPLALLKEWHGQEG